jgi:hypothetical protein
MREWIEDPRGMSVLAPFIQQLKDQMMGTFGGAESESIGMDPMGFLMDTPLLNLLHFLGGSLPVSPEEMVDGFLAMVQSKS